MHLARVPDNVDLLRQGDGRIVVRDHARGAAVGAGQGDAVVDVEDGVAALAARARVVGGRKVRLLGVDLAVGPNAAARDGGGAGGRVGRVSAEVVGRVEGARDALVELGEAVIGAVGDGEAEAGRVPQAQVQLAVLGAVLDAGAGADVGLEAVEAEGDDLGFLLVLKK